MAREEDFLVMHHDVSLYFREQGIHSVSLSHGLEQASVKRIEGVQFMIFCCVALRVFGASGLCYHHYFNMATRCPMLTSCCQREGVASVFSLTSQTGFRNIALNAYRTSSRYLFVSMLSISPCPRPQPLHCLFLHCFIVRGPATSEIETLAYRFTR
jgi:hypothetical protein